VSDIVTDLDTSKASQASGKLGLKVLLLMDLRAQILGLPPIGGTPLGFNMNQRPAFWNIVDDAVIAMYSMQVEIEDRSLDKPETLARIDVSLRAEYIFRPDFQRGTDETLIEHYVGIVGRMHAWPYFRAEVQGLSAKLGLPPLTLPVVMSGDMAKLPVARFAEPVPRKKAPLPASKRATSKPKPKRVSKLRAR
jgi:hypothetical protein